MKCNLKCHSSATLATFQGPHVASGTGQGRCSLSPSSLELYLGNPATLETEELFPESGAKCPKTKEKYFFVPPSPHR